jgi:hypothetical protein
MSARQLQERIDRMRAQIESGNLKKQYRDLYEGRLERFEQLLKEKADAGQMV